MTLRFLTLGTAPETGKTGVDMAISFKRQLRSVLPFPEGGYAIVAPTEGQRCEVRAAYDSSIPGAEAWARRAKELSGEIWAELAERRKEPELV